MRLLFVRHGESEANLLRVIANRGDAYPLTERGRAQAAALADRLRGEAISVVYTSPLLRARQTAAALGEACGAPVEVAEALREYDCGELEGRSDAQAWEGYARIQRAWFDAGDWAARPEGGESLHDIAARFVPFVQSLRAAYPGDATIALVGHGGLFRCALPFVLANVDHTHAGAMPVEHTSPIIVASMGDQLCCSEWCGAALPSAALSQP